MKVKICGITNVEDAQVAIEAGTDLLGFIFYPKSPRYVSPEAAASIIDQLLMSLATPLGHENRAGSVRDRPERSFIEQVSAQRAASHIRFVGVFVDEPVDRVREIVEQCHLDLAQLHGSEPPVEVRMLQPRAFKALRPKQRGDAEAMIATYAPVMDISADRPAFLIDAYHPWQYGGTGGTTDWIAAKVVARRYPILLAGGLTPDNVITAIQTVEPWGVDVSSGVEAEPGKKDHAKVRAFIEAVRTCPKNR